MIHIVHPKSETVHEIYIRGYDEMQLRIWMTTYHWIQSNVAMMPDGSIVVTGLITPNTVGNRFNVHTNALERYLRRIMLRERIPMLLTSGYPTPVLIEHASKMMNMDMSLQVLEYMTEFLCINHTIACDLPFLAAVRHESKSTMTDELRVVALKCKRMKADMFSYLQTRAGFATTAACAHYPIKECLKAMVMPLDDVAYCMDALVHLLKSR
jgi:regulator of extracellular matrix RemA (YlzA/DUF370 family)